jgi:hypothetical protein
MLGFGFVSLCIYLLAHFGHLEIRAIGSLFAVGVGFCGFVLHRRKVVREALQRLPHDLVFGLLLAFLCVCFGMLFKPYDATIIASDASVYLGTAHHLAREGTIKHHDPLVAEMTREERKVLFGNRFTETIPYARFPGGVPLVDPAKDMVTFYFYHLFPAWLAFGLETIGSEGYLRLLSLFASLSLVSLFLIGRSLSGNLLGLSLCIVQLFFFPQVYYSNFSSSELLAQSLFLSGLYMFINQTHRYEPQTMSQIYVCGLLWGALCLCRVDSIPFLFVGITIISVFSNLIGISFRVWLILIFSITLSSSIAIYHQLSNGIYIDMFDSFLFNSSVASMFSVLIVEWDFPGIIIVLGILFVMIAIFRRCHEQSRSTLFYISLKLLSVVLSAGFLVYFAKQIKSDLLVRHLHWILLYITPYLFATLLMGLVVVVSSILLKRAASNLSLLLAFFAIPAFCYLINPMVTAVQPWAIRRFVPMIFPLFFILSLYGWQEGLNLVCGPRIKLAQFIFAVMVILTAATFLHSSRSILGQPLFANVTAQLRELSRKIPEGAIVVIPDSDAGLHVQTALQYACARDTLLLPVAGSPGQRFEDVMSGFLVRQIDRGRRVFVLLLRPSDLAGTLVRHFQLTFVSETPISFWTVPSVPDDTFPGRIDAVRIQNLLFEVSSGREISVPISVEVGDFHADIPFIIDGFYGPEIMENPQEHATSYRWTGPVATLVFPPVASVSLTIDSWHPPQTEPADIQVQVDGMPVAVNQTPTERYRTIYIPLSKGLEKPPASRIVTLLTNTFNMKNLRLADDPRNLGVRLLRVTIEPLPAAHVTVAPL